MLRGAISALHSSPLLAPRQEKHHPQTCGYSLGILITDRVTKQWPMLNRQQVNQG